MDIKNIITIFYTLEEMQGIVFADSPSNSFLPSHEKFAEDLHNFQKTFNKNFSAMLYDYMVFVIMQELIDSATHCDDCFSRILGSDIRYVTTADLEWSYDRIDPDDLFNRANELFYDSYWHGPFGGPAWGQAVDYASLYGKVPDTVYIDNIVDLQHNTDSVLNKKNPFWEVGLSQCHQLSVLLNKKRKNQLWISQNYHIVKRFPLIVKKLLLRFINLYLPDWKDRNRFLSEFYTTDNNLSFDELMHYEPTEYSREFILGPIVSTNVVYSDEYYY